MKKVLFVAYGAGHIAMLIPVIRAIDGLVEPIVLGLTTAQQRLRDSRIPFLGFKDLIHLSRDQALVQKTGASLAQELGSGSVPFEETVAYLGINYCELEERYGKLEAKKRYQESGRQSFLPVQFMRRVLDYYQPDLVVATNSPRTEQAVILAAKEAGIPALCAVDLFALQEVAWIGKNGYADKVCVLSQQVKELLLRSGRREDEVVVTGNPAFDSLVTAECRQKGVELRYERGWKDDEKVILCASQVEPEKHPFAERYGNTDLPRAIERALMSIVQKHHNYKLVLRRHPSEQVKYSTLPAGVELSASAEALSPLLHAVDAVVVTASTVGLEAAIAGKPVVSVDMSVFTADAPYSKMGLSIGVDDLDQLELALESAFSGPAPQVNKFASDGRATDRMVKEICSMF